MWYHREISSKIEQLLAQFPLLVLTGARQVGKSSLLKKLLPSYNYVSLDLPTEAQWADVDPISFLREHPCPLIIDEVQQAPGLFKALKKKVDEAKTLKGQYVLSGSQKFSLMKGVKESLAGRAALMELLPLALGEIRRTHHQLPTTAAAFSHLEEYILRGGMPALYENSAIETSDYFRSYVGTYLERDVKEILEVSSLRDFERFVRACAARSGNLLNKSDLARDVGLSSVTMGEWLSVLQVSNQIYLLEPWFNNKSKSVTKSPKLYFLDTGLLCYLLNISSVAMLRQSPYLGAIWENFVFSEIYKTLSLRGEERALHFWRDRNREIDFVIDRGALFDLVEVKWTEHPTTHDCERLNYFKEQVLGRGEKIHSLSIMARGETEFPIGPSGCTKRSIFNLDFLSDTP